MFDLICYVLPQKYPRKYDDRGVPGASREQGAWWLVGVECTFDAIFSTKHFNLHSACGALMRRQQPTSTPNTHELPSRSRSKKQAPMLTQVRSVAPFTGAHEAVSASGPRAPYTLEEGVMPKGMEFMRGPGAKLPFSTHINTPRRSSCLNKRKCPHWVEAICPRLCHYPQGQSRG